MFRIMYARNRGVNGPLKGEPIGLLLDKLRTNGGYPLYPVGEGWGEGGKPLGERPNETAVASPICANIRAITGALP